MLSCTKNLKFVGILNLKRLEIFIANAGDLSEGDLQDIFRKILTFPVLYIGYTPLKIGLFLINMVDRAYRVEYIVLKH